MRLKIYDTNTFAHHLFSGNPAKVCVVPKWLSDTMLHSIAQENNLSEVAFIKKNPHGYDIRWFNKRGEERLCGHGTLAAAHIVDKVLTPTPGKPIRFHTQFYDDLVAKPQNQSSYQLSLPRLPYTKVSSAPAFLSGFSVQPINVYKGLDYLLEYSSSEDIHRVNVDYKILQNVDARGIIITAPSKKLDCVSRCFYPFLTASEDTVTGSAHCMIAPFWSSKKQQNPITALQYSRELNRSGIVQCYVHEDRVLLTGNVVIYLDGHISLPGNESSY